MSQRDEQKLVWILDDIAMIALALCSAFILVIESSTELPPSYIVALDGIDVAIAIVFLAEFCIKFALAPRKSSFLRTHWWELLAAIPITTPATQALRLLRLFRLIRLFRLNEGFREILDYLRHFFQQTYILTVLVIWLLIVCAGTTAFFAFEHLHNPHTPSLFDSLWWAISTITTVGYGDIYPVTVGGRIVGMLLMLCGIGTTGVFTALIASFLVRERTSRKT